MHGVGPSSFYVVYLAVNVHNFASLFFLSDYDYSDLEVNPLCPLDEPMEPSMPLRGPRPEWSVVGKINENMETILFREKFTKWPDGGKLIKMKGKDKESENGDKCEALNLSPADVAPMLADEMADANLVLEGIFFRCDLAAL